MINHEELKATGTWGVCVLDKSVEGKEPMSVSDSGRDSMFVYPSCFLFLLLLETSRRTLHVDFLVIVRLNVKYSL